jgi:hypothetical protein
LHDLKGLLQLRSFDIDVRIPLLGIHQCLTPVLQNVALRCSPCCQYWVQRHSRWSHNLILNSTLESNFKAIFQKKATDHCYKLNWKLRVRSKLPLNPIWLNISDLLLEVLCQLHCKSNRNGKNRESTKRMPYFVPLILSHITPW